MFEENIPAAVEESQLQAWRMALAGLEGERARLVAKYDQRIAEMKKAIKELEKTQKQQPKPAEKETVAKKSKPSGKAKSEE